MLAKENNTQTETNLEALWEDILKKYEVVGEALQLAAEEAPNAEKPWLFNQTRDIKSLIINKY